MESLKATVSTAMGSKFSSETAKKDNFATDGATILVAAFVALVAAFVALVAAFVAPPSRKPALQAGIRHLTIV